MKKRLFAAIIVLSVTMMTGCGAKEESVSITGKQSARRISGSRPSVSMGISVR